MAVPIFKWSLVFNVFGASKVAFVLDNTSVLDDNSVLDDPLRNDLALHLVRVAILLSLAFLSNLQIGRAHV